MKAQIVVIELEKLSHRQDAMVISARANLCLQEQGLIRHPVAVWNSRGLLALSDGVAVGLLTFKEDDDDLTAEIELVYVDEGNERVLARLLSAVRAKLQAGKSETVSFSYHPANLRMAQAAKVFGVQPFCVRCRVDIKRRQP